jgi:hypothetical protein
MSRMTHQSEDVIVYDDILPASECIQLFRYINVQQFASVHARNWRKVWRLHDGNPLTSKAVWYFPNIPTGGVSSDPIYPTGLPIDYLVRWIINHTPEIHALVGGAATDWEKFSCASWIYPPGSGLSLHQDGFLYSGAFTYFAHQVWRLHWGGQLLVLDPRTRPIEIANGELSPPFLDDSDESQRALDPGFALTVFPKPNRIVFLSPTAQHLMTRVDENAGQAARVSVAGFFHRPIARTN